MTEAPCKTKLVHMAAAVPPLLHGLRGFRYVGGHRIGFIFQEESAKALGKNKKVRKDKKRNEH